MHNRWYKTYKQANFTAFIIIHDAVFNNIVIDLNLQTG